MRHALLFLALSALPACTIETKVPTPQVTVDCLVLVVGQARAEACEGGAADAGDELAE